MPVCLCEVLVPMCCSAEVLSCVCLARAAPEAAASCSLCLSGCGPCRGQRKSSCSEVCIRTKRFSLPFVAQGDSVLLLFLLELRCRSDSGGGYQVLALHRSLIAQRKKNNLVFVSACLSLAVKLADGWLGCLDGRKEEERKQEWEKKGRIGILRVKNVFLFSASVSVPSHPLQRNL